MTSHPWGILDTYGRYKNGQLIAICRGKDEFIDPRNQTLSDDILRGAKSFRDDPSFVTWGDRSLISNWVIYKPARKMIEARKAKNLSPWYGGAKTLRNASIQKYMYKLDTNDYADATENDKWREIKPGEYAW